jgi:hypothetical protein
MRLGESVGDGTRRPSPMPKMKSDRKKSSERVLALGDLEQAKAAVLDSLVCGGQ